MIPPVFPFGEIKAGKITIGALRVLTKCHISGMTREQFRTNLHEIRELAKNNLKWPWNESFGTFAAATSFFENVCDDQTKDFAVIKQNFEGTHRNVNLNSGFDGFHLVVGSAALTMKRTTWLKKAK
jgi:hypothetical protein